jgi:hypothetical protein
MKSKTEIEFELQQWRQELRFVKGDIYEASKRRDTGEYEKLIYRQEDLLSRIETLEWVLK